MTKVLNFYGGPGTGKSTSAAFAFYALKQAGHNSELVSEYVKGWAWENRKPNAYDQLYFLGKQIRKESMLYSKVDYIVTDSPILINAYYSAAYTHPLIAAGVEQSIRGYYTKAAEDGHEHHHVFLRRTKPYNQSGRFQNEEEAKGIDVALERLLNNWQLKVEECGTDEFSLRQLIATIVAR